MTFQDALKLLRREECAPDCVAGDHAACFTNDPDDPGGATCCGIVQQTYDGYRLAKGLSRRSVKEHDWAEHEEIYFQRFWIRGNCGALKWPLSLIHFDACVNHGTEAKGTDGTRKINAGKLLQKALLLPVPERDGIVGPETIRLVALMPIRELCCRYLLERLFRYDELVDSNPRLAKYLSGGWESRLEHLYQETTH